METATGTGTQGTKRELVTPIEFATALGKAPQEIYRLLRDKQFPKDTLEVVKIGDKERTLLVKDAALSWYAARPTRGHAAVNIITNPDDVIARMVDMFKIVAKEHPQNKVIKELVDGLDKLMVKPVDTTTPQQ